MTGANPWLDRRVLGWAHRGGAGEAPENTLPAFRHGIAAGAHGLELDVRATADGALVVIHDATLERVTEAVGRVADASLDELRDVTVTAGPQPPEGRDGCHIPLLDEVLEGFADVLLTIEIKASASEVEHYEARVADRLRAHGRTDEVIVGSLDERALQRFRATAPELATSATSEEIFQLWSDGRPPDPGANVVAVQVPRTYEGVEVVTGGFVTNCHEAGLAVHVWTVDESDEMRRLADLGVDGIMTDRPTVLSEVLADLDVAWGASP